MPVPTPPGVSSPNCIRNKGTNPPIGVMESCTLLTAPVDVPVVADANKAEAAIPKRVSLPSMLPPDCEAVGAASIPWEADHRVAALFADEGDGCEGGEQNQHRGHEREALAAVAYQDAERVGESERNQQDRGDLQKVGERRGILEGMRGIGIEKAAAVGAELLDGFLRGDGPHGQNLGLSRDGLGDRVALVIQERFALAVCFRIIEGQLLDRGRVAIGMNVLDHALTDEGHGEERR